MKKIKYLVITLVAMALMPSCSNKTEQEEATRHDSINTELNDSLATALAEKDSLMALMNDINEGMNQLKELQDVVSMPGLSGETPDRKAQLRSDMELLQKAVAQRKKRLEDLEKRLAQSQNYNDEMRKTIETLKKQLANQQSTIDDLTQQLAEAHIVINTLNTRVDSLNTVNTEVRQEKAKAQEEAVRVTNEMNTCYYAIGNKKELMNNRIIETGFLKKTKIMEGDFEKSYFTKADKRTLSTLPLHSKKAKLLSKHPAGTYQIVDEGGTKSLHITDPGRFWELSNYLIVQID